MAVFHSARDSLCRRAMMHIHGLENIVGIVCIGIGKNSHLWKDVDYDKLTFSVSYHVVVFIMH